MVQCRNHFVIDSYILKNLILFPSSKKKLTDSFAINECSYWTHPITYQTIEILCKILILLGIKSPANNWFYCVLEKLDFFPSRDDWIRTSGPYVPNVVRYRAALHPENDWNKNKKRHWKKSAVFLKHINIELQVLKLLNHLKNTFMKSGHKQTQSLITSLVST